MWRRNNRLLFFYVLWYILIGDCMSNNKNIMYHLLPANNEYFTISDMKDSITKGGIEWANGYAGGKNSQKFDIDDVVYIYYKNLTDGTRRILFRGVVSYVSNILKKFPDGKEYKYFVINNISSINLYNDRNIDVSCYGLKEYNVNINRNIQYLGTQKKLEDYINNKDIYDNNGEKKKLKLIYDLEKNIDRYRNSIDKAIEYFSNYDFCECCKILGYSSSKCKLRTFKKNNGFTYYEIHHLIMRSTLNKDKSEYLEKINKNTIDMEFNRINLCPVCHREFHYGNFGGLNMKRHIIEELMTKHKFIDELEKLEISKEDIDKIKEYTINQYI